MSTKTSIKGFSLIEVMVAVVMLTIIVFGVVRLQTSYLSLADSQNSQSKAYFLAQQGLQILQAIEKDEIEVHCEGGTCICTLNQETDYGFACGDGPEEIEGFERYLNIDGNSLENDAWLVESVVEWQDQTGNHQVSSKSVIYE